MPRRLRKRIDRIEKNLSYDQLSHLISGYTLDGPDPKLGGIDKSGFEMPFSSDDHRRECWEKNKKYIMNLAGQLAPKNYFWAARDENGRRVYFPKGELPAAAKDCE